MRFHRFQKRNVEIHFTRKENFIFFSKFLFFPQKKPIPNMLEGDTTLLPQTMLVIEPV